MKHHVAGTSRFPIHLWFAGGCLAFLPSGAGLTLGDILGLGYGYYSIVVASLCPVCP